MGLGFHIAYLSTNQDSENYSFTEFDILMPKQIKPIHYDINLELILSEFTFSGKSNATFELTHSTNFIPIHADKLTITNINLVSCEHSHKRNTEKCIMNYQMSKLIYKKPQKYIIIYFDSVLSPGCYVLKMTYTGVLNNEDGGFSIKDIGEKVNTHR